MQTNIYEIKNVGFLNKGAELMLIAIAQGLQRLDGGCRLALQPTKASPYEQRVRYGAFQKIGGAKGGIDLSWTASLIPVWFKKNWGLISDNDLAGIFDASGYAYGGHWNPSMLKHAAAQAVRMKRKGGLFVMMPQAFGAFRSKRLADTMAGLAQSADLIFARDPQSKSHLEQAGVRMDKIRVFPDFTATVPPSPTQVPDGPYACIVPNIKVASAMNENSAVRDKYHHFLCRAIEHLRRLQITPYFVLHHLKDDKDVCRAVNERLKKPAAIMKETDPRKIKYLLGKARINVCSRFHACVSSLCQNVPALATSWSHKYEMLYSDFSAGQLVITDYDAPEEAIDAVLADMAGICAALRHASAEIKNEIDTMWALIADIIKAKLPLESVEGSVT